MLNKVYSYIDFYIPGMQIKKIFIFWSQPVGLSFRQSLKPLLMWGSISILNKESCHYALSCDMTHVP